MSTGPCSDCAATSVELGGRGVHLVIPSIIAPILAFFLVANRVYWRLRMLSRLGFDDVSTILAMVFLVVQCVASITAVNAGYGRASSTLNENQAVQALKCFFVLQIFYKLTINFTKLSILFLYLRIFTEHMWFRRVCWLLVTVVLGACTSFTMATILQCRPVSRAWDRWSGHGTCVDIGALWYSNAIYNIMTDIIIVLMVPPVIFKLQLPMRQKLALTCVFGLGVIVCGASISRLTTLYSSAYGDDVTAGSLVSTIWTTIEAGLGVICANLPMLRTPLQHFFPQLFPPRTASNPISSRAGSRPSCWSNSEALASPTRLIPPLPPSMPACNARPQSPFPCLSRSNTLSAQDQAYARGEIARVHEPSGYHTKKAGNLRGHEESQDTGRTNRVVDTWNVNWASSKDGVW